MSWQAAITNIAEQMDAEAKDLEGSGPEILFHRHSLKGFARQLRSVVTASGDTPDPAQQVPVQNQASMMAALVPQFQHFNEIEKAREQIRKERKKTEAEEGLSQVMILCVDGPAEDTYAQVPNDMPLGAKIDIASTVYVMSEENGHRVMKFSKEDTIQRYTTNNKTAKPSTPSNILLG